MCHSENSMGVRVPLQMIDHQIRIWKGSEHLELSLQIKALLRSWAREAREIALHSLASLRHIGLLQTSCALQTITTLHLINLYLMLYIGCLETFFYQFYFVWSALLWSPFSQHLYTIIFSFCLHLWSLLNIHRHKARLLSPHCYFS